MFISQNKLDRFTDIFYDNLLLFLDKYALDGQITKVNLEGVTITLYIYPVRSEEPYRLGRKPRPVKHKNSDLSRLLSTNDNASTEFDNIVDDSFENTLSSNNIKKINHTTEYKNNMLEVKIIFIVIKPNNIVIQTGSPDIYNYEKSNPVVMIDDVKSYGTLVKKIGSGAYGVVKLYQKGDEKYAIKFMNSISDDGDLATSPLREISIMQRCDHPYIVQLLGIVKPGQSDKVGIIMPQMQSDLKSYLVDNTNIPQDKLIKYIYQIIVGTAYLHSRDIIHRDLKPANILYDSVDDRMVLTDFGISRALACPPGTNKTLQIVTLWYRPPEILLGGNEYLYLVDVWSLGTIIYEILTKRPLFPGYSDTDTIVRIFRKLGTPTDETWPGVSNYPNWMIYPTWPRINKLRMNNYMEGVIMDTTNIDMDVVDDILQLINDALTLNPVHRPSVFELMNNQLFDNVRQKNLEPQHFSCLDNLYLRRKSPIENRFELPSNTEVNSMRPILLDWLIKVARMYKLQPETFFMIQYLLDQYLPSNIKKGDLQGFGVSCMIVAGSYLEIYSPEIDDYVSISDGAYSAEWLIKESQKLLEVIKYDLVITTVSNFVKVYSKSFYTPEISALATKLLYIGIFFENPFVYSEYEQALWAIYYACRYYGTEYKHESLLPISSIMKYPLRKPKLQHKAAIKLLHTITNESFNDFMEKVNE